MRKFALVLALLAISFTANAGGFKILTVEEIVTTVLSSKELAAEKEANKLLGSMTLGSVEVESEKNLTTVYLLYANGGAPCSVRAEVQAKNIIPKGAPGVHMIAKIVTLKSVCAMP